MKKYLSLLLIPAAFIYSCKKNVGNLAVGPVPSIVGTWTIAADTVKDYDHDTVSSTTGNTYNKGETYHFNADGSGAASIDTVPGSLKFTYTVTDNKVALNYPAQYYNNTSPGATIDTARVGLLTPTSLELIYKGYFFGKAGSDIYYESDVYLVKQIQISE